MINISINKNSLFNECLDLSLMECASADLAIDESNRFIFKNQMDSTSIDIESAARCRLEGVDRGVNDPDIITYKFDDLGIDTQELALIIRELYKVSLMCWWYSSKNPTLFEVYNRRKTSYRSKLVFITKGSYTMRPYRLI